MKLTGRILVIDDDLDLLQLLETILVREGHTVLAASGWAEAVSQLNDAARENVEFDVVFLDLMMPERSGFDVLRSLKVILFPLPPIVVLTALDDIEHAVKALELGATKYMTKPVARDKLVETVRDILLGRPVSRF